MFLLRQGTKIRGELDKMLFSKFSNWERLRLALLNSISTGVFIDVRFYAYSAVGNDTTFGPKSLFTSSIVIQKWAPTIATRKSKSLLNPFHSNVTEESTGTGSRAACLLDSLIDDYEPWNSESPEILRENTSLLYVSRS